jgi:hypothetical protein
MYHAVEFFCNTNIAIINTKPAFAAAFAAFVSKITVLVGSQAIVLNPTLGIAKDKSALKKILCKTASDIASLVFAYANKTNNQTLSQQVNYSFTRLYRKPSISTAVTCKNIYDLANNNLAALEFYGVTVAMLSALQTAISNYSDSVPKPQNAKATKQTANANIKKLIKEVDKILKNEMDKLVVGFKTANPNFVITYFNIRVIIDPAGTSKKDKPNTGSPELE